MGETGKPQKALRPNEVAMDVKTFVIELLSALGELDFVQDIDLQVDRDYCFRSGRPREEIMGNRQGQDQRVTYAPFGEIQGTCRDKVSIGS